MKSWRCLFLLITSTLLACAVAPPEPEKPRRAPRPHVSGGSLLLNMQPVNRPNLVGSYDFELLEEGAGKRCIKRSDVTVYWTGILDVDALAPDVLSRQAIAAAAHDAIQRLDGADSILLTRVVTVSEGPDERCATVIGRGIRLVKARPPAPAPTPAADDDDDD